MERLGDNATVQSRVSKIKIHSIVTRSETASAVRMRLVELDAMLGRVVRRMNEVTLHQARLVLGWVTVFGRVYHHGITSQLGKLSLASLRSR